MKRSTIPFLLFFCMAFCNNSGIYGQKTYTVSDVKGIWLSYMYYDSDIGEFKTVSGKDVISFGFTESKGKLNKTRYTGLYRVIEGGIPQLFYYSFENNRIVLYDSSDSQLPYSLKIESVIPQVSLTAIVVYTEGNKITSTKMRFLFHEKK